MENPHNRAWCMFEATSRGIVALLAADASAMLLGLTAPSALLFHDSPWLDSWALLALVEALIWTHVRWHERRGIRSPSLRIARALEAMLACGLILPCTLSATSWDATAPLRFAMEWAQERSLCLLLLGSAIIACQAATSDSRKSFPWQQALNGTLVSVRPEQVVTR